MNAANLCVISLILGILGVVISLIFTPGLLLSILAGVFLHIGFSRAKRSTTGKGKGMAIAGMATGHFSITIVTIAVTYGLLSM